MANSLANTARNSVIPTGSSRDDKPRMEDLQEYVVRQYAARWKELGLALGLKDYIIDNIQENNARHPRQVEECCKAMLQQWLKEISSPSWGKLDDAIISIYKPSDITGCKAANEISSYLKEYHTAGRFAPPDIHEWPPEQLKFYTPLVLIHHKSQLTSEQIKKLAKVKGEGRINSIIATASDQQKIHKPSNDKSLKKCLQESTAKQDLSDILVPLEALNDEPRIVLIEGAPGFGKTVLLKQIAYEWAQGKLLVNSLLIFLVLLRDPNVQKISSIDEFMYYCYGVSETSKVCAGYIFKTRGKNVTFLLDGYDELPSRLQRNGFIANIINHKVLPMSSVVVTSRPHATACLRSYATCHVDILGFSKENLHHYIQKSLETEPDKSQKLLKYLDSHPAIMSLCYAPFNATVLLWLFKQGVSLPKCSTDMYNCFICHTLRHHLAKHGVTLDNITDLDSLPEPYKGIIQRLSVLCYEALDKNQLVFTLQELKSACPDIEIIPGAINGFGLLQAVEHFSVDLRSMGMPTKTLNFIHFSVQEFLAAYLVTLLSSEDEWEFLNSKFNSSFHFNVFAMYVGITKGKRPNFKRFLSCSDKKVFPTYRSHKIYEITEKTQNDRKCIKLLQCFYEADDEKACKNIFAKYCRNKTISLYTGTCSQLTSTDVHWLTIILSSFPRKKWNELNLMSCSVGDTGIKLLHRSLITTKISIDYLSLSINSLTLSSVEEIAEIAVHCKIIKLTLSSNSLEDGTWLETIVSKPSSIKHLLIDDNKLTSTGAVSLFTALKRNDHTSLKVLDLSCNHIHINDAVVAEISAFLHKSNTLTDLRLANNNIEAYQAQQIVQSLMCNVSLLNLYLPWLSSSDVRLNLKITERQINDRRSYTCYNHKLLSIKIIFPAT